MPQSAQANAMDRCIQDCIESHRACLETVGHCLSKGGRHAQPEHIRVLMDAAQICQTSADFMIRQSDLHAEVCGACAEVMSRCAEACARMADDEQMKRCEESSRRTEESCRRMASDGATEAEAAGAPATH